MAQYRIYWVIGDDMGASSLTVEAASKQDVLKTWNRHRLGELLINHDLQDDPKLQGAVQLHMDIESVEEVDGR